MRLLIGSFLILSSLLTGCGDGLEQDSDLHIPPGGIGSLDLPPAPAAPALFHFRPLAARLTCMSHSLFIHEDLSVIPSIKTQYNIATQLSCPSESTAPSSLKLNVTSQADYKDWNGKDAGVVRISFGKGEAANCLTLGAAGPAADTGFVKCATTNAQDSELLKRQRWTLTKNAIGAWRISPYAGVANKCLVATSQKKTVLELCNANSSMWFILR